MGGGGGYLISRVLMFSVHPVFLDMMIYFIYTGVSNIGSLSLRWFLRGLLDTSSFQSVSVVQDHRT